MATKKYPIGTKIKYIGSCPKCKGHVGKVVEVSGASIYITLPQSLCRTFHFNNRIMCPWEDIEPVIVKGQHLLFAFMED